jgi:hypothetical protein
MRKTARPVVWEGDGAQIPSLDPITALKYGTELLKRCTKELRDHSDIP